MWQVPQQFECLVSHLGRVLRDGMPLRTLCIGTWSGWTDVLLTSMLRRLSHNVSHTTFDVTNFVAGRVAAYKHIQNVTFVPEIPKSASGKILRRVLRDRLKEGSTQQ